MGSNEEDRAMNVCCMTGLCVPRSESKESGLAYLEWEDDVSLL